jgi:hypothetical protein
MEEVKIHKFDLKIINKRRSQGECPIIVCIGSRSSGKSFLVREISYFIKDIPLVIVQSSTEPGTGFFSEFVHPLFIYNDFEPDVLISVLNHQKKKAETLKKEGRELKYEVNEHVCIILDDLAFDKSLMKLPAMRELFFNGRHFGIVLIITFQYLMDLGPAFRGNVNYVICCKENKKDTIDKLHKYFFGIFDKVSDFRKVLSTCTNDYRCLVLENTPKSERIEDLVFWYKAVHIKEKFRMCADKWPEWDKKLKIKNASNTDEDEDEKAFTRRNKKSDLVIKMTGPKRNL